MMSKDLDRRQQAAARYLGENVPRIKAMRSRIEDKFMTRLRDDQNERVVTDQYMHHLNELYEEHHKLADRVNELEKGKTDFNTILRNSIENFTLGEKK